MANLKEIRGRITSISSTMQITSAMKMVSAAKLKSTDAIVMLRPYSEKFRKLSRM
jgi:F-type H+-transporting ATPase subunit gamma